MRFFEGPPPRPCHALPPSSPALTYNGCRTERGERRAAPRSVRARRTRKDSHPAAPASPPGGREATRFFYSILYFIYTLGMPIGGDLGSFGGELVRERTERSNRAILSISSRIFLPPAFPFASRWSDVGSVRRVKYRVSSSFFLDRIGERAVRMRRQTR